MRLFAIRKRRRIASELDEEMQLHRELRAQQLEQGGISHDRAWEQAGRSFGNKTLLREESLEVWKFNWLEDFGSDVRYALSWMCAKPLFTIIIIATLALGIGANSAIFSLANAVLLRTLPVHDAERLYYLHILPEQPDGAGNTGDGKSSFSYAVYHSLRQQRHAFENVIAYVPLGFNKIAVRTGSIPEEAAVDMVSGDFFSALGVPLICGAGFRAGDEEKGSGVAVIGYGLWNLKFGHSCSALGKTIFVKGIPFTITGVAPKDFRGVEVAPATDVWIPLQRRPELNAWGMDVTNYRSDSKWWCLRLIARIPPGIDAKQAASIASPSFTRIAYEPLGGKPHVGEQPRQLDLVPARGLGQPDLRKPLSILFGMVALLLFVACANVAMLLVARNTSRQREFGIRLALGSGQMRLFRQLLTESFLLVAMGALLGYGLAWQGTTLLAHWAEIDASLAPDTTVLLFTLIVSAMIAVAFGLVPLVIVGRSQAVGLISQGSQSTGFTGRTASRSRQAVLVIQIALGLVLTVGAGLLTHSLRNLEARKLGFRPERLLVFGVNTPQDARSGPKNTRFFAGLLERVRQVPGVQAAASVENRPGTGWSNNTNAWIDGHTEKLTSKNGSNMMRYNDVGPGYFATMGIPLLQGRDFNEADSDKAPKVAIVNETFAKNFFPNRSPLGHTVSFTSSFGFTIVGIVADSAYTSLREAAAPMGYFPNTQALGAMHIEVRTALDPESLIPEIRKQVTAYDPGLALLQPRTQAAEFASTIDTERLLARLGLFFGGMAAALVAIGLYGTLSYRVDRRTSELGIRMALGAQKVQIFYLVLRESLLVLLIGITLGVPLAMGAGRWLASLLYELTPSDPLSLTMAVTGIAIVTLAASLLPAQRAASVDPLFALRHE